MQLRECTISEDCAQSSAPSRLKKPGTAIQTAVLGHCPHSLSRLRQAGLSEAVDKVISYRCIAQRLGAEPMADREMRVGDQEQFCFSPRLVMLAQLRKRSCQELA